MALPEDFYKRLYDRAAKRLRYQDGEDFQGWAERVRDKLADLLGLPDRQEKPDVDLLSSEPCDGYVREKVLIKNGMIDALPIYVLTPEEGTKPRPGIICLHGHGGYMAGKDMVAGVTDTHPIAIECSEALNYGYGVLMAKAGYACVCTDGFNFGDRLLAEDRWSEEHICDKYFAGLAPYGLVPMGVTTAGNMQAIDYLLTRPDVKGDRIGCIGLSYGGVQAYMLTCVDRRVGAAVISGSLSSFRASPGPRCGASVVPGLLDWFDQVDIQKAIAPRPVLYEIMTQDTSFDYEQSMAQYAQIKSVYESLSAENMIDLDQADTDHRYIGKKVEAFFKQHHCSATYIE
ncbi:MAG: alpha/beta hydrolase family protein [Planctomycetota bacterium]|jgi:dienelactone hydrolase|nr:alpha/beta hydrolase family protein [Planctomycetota bacterium]